MSREELNAYYKHLDNIVILRDNIMTERAEGRAEGIAEGIAEGRAEGRAEGIAEGRAEGRAEGIAEGRAETQTAIARNLKSLGLSTEQIQAATGLSAKEIEQL